MVVDVFRFYFLRIKKKQNLMSFNTTENIIWFQKWLTSLETSKDSEFQVEQTEEGERKNFKIPNKVYRFFSL